MRNEERFRFEIYPILNAKVPIIKMRKIGRTALEMDIAIQSSQQSVANLMNFYCDYDDRVRPCTYCIDCIVSNPIHSLCPYQKVEITPNRMEHVLSMKHSHHCHQALE